MMGDCLLFYVKFPERGRVKTRLAKDLGEIHALELYKCFVADMLQTFTELNATICVCYSPESSLKPFQDWLGPRYQYVPQRGGDLGTRMCRSFQDAFRQGFARALVVGSDIPDLPARALSQSFSRLHTYDAVVGPSDDGGYYLLGFRRESFCPDVFQHIPWSTSQVYEATIEKLRGAERTFFHLPVWSDIDNLTDLHQWYRHDRDNSRAVQTLAYLSAYEDTLFSCMGL